ncbi:MAG: ABC transporter ATP-binding protein, partial [Oscillospiraceae bacterium]|nr:ABC transporter ATP-binding protein [Oscillospiraceae bacterium]
MSILKAEALCFTYQNKSQTVRAVKDVTCSFDEGRAYAIVGKSGSGKTTLLSLLAGLELPTEGAVFFEGKATADMDCDLYRRDHAAVIYQSYNLFPLLTAQENVLYPLKLRGVDGKTALELAQKELKAVGIQPDQFKRFPSQLSGGEQQRVAIARALAAGNRIVLADEPTGNLDITNGEQVVEILLRLAHEEGRCVIVVTHDLEIAS